MKNKPIVPLAIVSLCALAACQANPQATARNIPLSQAAAGANQPQDWALAALEVSVPQSLTVSEENSIKPRADIVWREDPCCDRHAQVDAILTEALQSALAPLAGSQPVRVTIEVTRFHAVTERTRYTTGGEHEIEFILTVFDAATGAVLRGPRAVDLTFPAAGGDEAIANEARGYFQRDAIHARVFSWAQVEFRLAEILDLQD